MFRVLVQPWFCWLLWVQYRDWPAATKKCFTKERVWVESNMAVRSSGLSLEA